MKTYIEDEFVLKRNTCNQRGIIRGFAPSNNYYVVEFFAQVEEKPSPENLEGGRITDMDILYNGRGDCAFACRNGQLTIGYGNKDEAWMTKNVLMKLREFRTAKKLGLMRKEEMKV